MKRFLDLLDGLDANLREMVVLQYRFMALVEYFGLPPIMVPADQDVGVSTHSIRAMDEALTRYDHMDDLIRILQTIADECREGRTVQRASFLRAALDCRKFVPISQLPCTEAEIKQWHRACIVQRMRALLAECRRGERRNIAELAMFVNGSTHPCMFDTPISLTELETSREELEHLIGRGLLPG